MKPEKLLYAMNDIDSRFLLEAREESAAPRRHRRPGVLIAAVIALMGLAVTAFAAEEIAGWFKQYFSRPEAPLSPGQIEFIEENEQIIQETQATNGYHVELGSVLADGNNAYAVIRITAPTNVTREQLEMLSGLGIDIYDETNTPCGTWGLQVCDDSDGLENTAEYIINFSPADWNSGSVWTIRVDKLVISIYDEEYEHMLLENKYAGQENIMFTDEEAARIYQTITLAEGPWAFTFDLSQAVSAELELITAPVSALTCYGYKPDGTEVTEEIQITSFILRPLGATVSAKSTGALDLTYTADRQIYVVMKGGSRIQLLPSWGATGQQYFDAASPLVLEDVDHVLLPDGTKLIVP